MRSALYTRRGLLDPDVARFVLAALPPAPARVLEIGAGDGALAQKIRSSGYDVVAIDPAGECEGVEPVALHEVSARGAAFDAAVAVVSLHHVEPLSVSLDRLAGVMRPGGVLVVDEFDVERLDERAAAWWLERTENDHGHPTPTEIVAELRHHCHAIRDVRAALSPWFDLGDEQLGPYLYRWNLPPGHRPHEEREIASGNLPATGVRFIATRTNS